MGAFSVTTANEAADDVSAESLFERLFQRHYARVYRVLAGLVGPDEAEDAAQEVFLRLYHSAMLGQPDDQIAAWLYRVAVNSGYNRLRSRQRRASWLERLAGFARVGTAARQAELDPLRVATEREEAALLRAALAELSPTHRVVLLLRQAGLSYAEVAAAAGVKPGSVGTLLARAEARLRDHYHRLAGSAHRPGTTRGASDGQMS